MDSSHYKPNLVIAVGFNEVLNQGDFLTLNRASKRHDFREEKDISVFKNIDYSREKSPRRSWGGCGPGSIPGSPTRIRCTLSSVG